MSKLKIFSLIVLLVLSLNLVAKDYKASLFGVKSDGVTLNTQSIQKAVNFISENGGGRLQFYVGRYLTGSFQLRSNVTIQLEEGAVLVATSSVYDYIGLNGTKALILADQQENIGITGKGVIEGEGVAVLENIKTQIQKGYLKATIVQASPALIYFNGCKNVNLEGINLWNSCGDVQSYKGCKNLTISKISIKSKLVAGSKGMLLSGCEKVKVEDSFFETSGTELSTTGNSKQVVFVNCKSASGKKIQTNQ